MKSGLEAALDYIKNHAFFYSAAKDDSVCYFAHCISQSGTYLSKMAGIEAGRPIAYLIAPPVEAVMGLDAALKEARVEMKVFYGPPTETNFGGGLLTGTQASCRRACEAFGRAVCKVAADPVLF